MSLDHKSAYLEHKRASQCQENSETQDVVSVMRQLCRSRTLPHSPERSLMSKNRYGVISGLRRAEDREAVVARLEAEGIQPGCEGTKIKRRSCGSKEGEQPRFWHNGGSIILFKIHPNAGIAGRGHGPFDGHFVGGVKVEVDHRFPITVDGHIRVDFIRNIFAKFQRTAALF